MTVAAASLDNLIPNVAKWEGFTTAPVRVPEQLKNWVIDMVNQKVQELRIVFGAESPADQEEQEWVNEIMGLPAEHKPGDPLPADLAAAVAEAKAQNTSIEVESVAIEPQAVAASAIAVVDKEPPEFTRAWLDWAARKDPKFDEPKYINDVKQEAAGGDPSAQRDLARLVADGVNVGDPIPAEQKLSRRQAKQARRLERQKKASGGKLQTVPTVSNILYSPQAEEYYKILPVYRQQAAERIAEFNAFFDELKERNLTGKIKRFRGYLDQHLSKPIEVHLSKPPLSLLDFLDPSACGEYRDSVNAIVKELSEDFYATEAQQQEDNLDGRFYLIMQEIAYCWHLSAVIAAEV